MKLGPREIVRSLKGIQEADLQDKEQLCIQFVDSLSDRGLEEMSYGPRAIIRELAMVLDLFMPTITDPDSGYTTPQELERILQEALSDLKKLGIDDSD